MQRGTLLLCGGRRKCQRFCHRRDAPLLALLARTAYGYSPFACICSSNTALNAYSLWLCGSICASLPPLSPALAPHISVTTRCMSSLSCTLSGAEARLNFHDSATHFGSAAALGRTAAAIRRPQPSLGVNKRPTGSRASETRVAREIAPRNVGVRLPVAAPAQSRSLRPALSLLPRRVTGRACHRPGAHSRDPSPVLGALPSIAKSAHILNEVFSRSLVGISSRKV